MAPVIQISPTDHLIVNEGSAAHLSCSLLAGSPTTVQPKPVIQYVEKEPSLSSLRIKAEKEKELAEAESYWRKRFAKQEREVILVFIFY